MSQVENSVLIGASIMSKRINKIDGTPEAKFKIVAAEVMNECAWLFHGSPLQAEDQAFKASVGALMLVSDDETKERITYEMKMLDALSTMMRGIPVDTSQMVRDDIEPLGLLGIWREAHPQKEQR